MAKEFTDTVSTMRNGAADRAASEAMAKLVEAVRATGEAGSITLKLGIKPLKDGDGELEVTASVGLSLPKVKIPTGIYYATEDNKLTRTDPRQLSMLGNDDGKTVDLTARRISERDREG